MKCKLHLIISVQVKSLVPRLTGSCNHSNTAGDNQERKLDEDYCHKPRSAGSGPSNRRQRQPQGQLGVFGAEQMNHYEVRGRNNEVYVM